MKIKKGDMVIMRSGKDRGKQGKILAVDRALMRVTVEGLNLLTKHRKPRRAGEKGQRMNVPRSVAASAVALICPQCGKPTRVGSKHLEGGAKTRRCVRCQATFA